MVGTILMMSGDTPRMKPTAAGLHRAAEIGHHDPAAVEAVLQDTWGHMRAEPGRVYSGHVIFAHSCNRDTTVLDWQFEDLSGGPWFPHQLMEFIDSRVPVGTEGFRIWRFDGTFTEMKNGKARFRGKVRPQRVVNRFPSPSSRRTRSATTGTRAAA